MAQPIIQVRGLTKRFETEERSVQALEGVDLNLEPGRFVSLVGPSGCGKSTLLNILAGLSVWDDGDVQIDGTRVDGPNPDRVGMVFQESLLLPWKTALENVEFPLTLRGSPVAERRSTAEGLLELVGLRDFAQAYPHELSVGMRQRVAIARGLVHDPKLLLMDEPFAALDEQSRLKMGQELLAIWQRTGKTILFVTHSLSEAIYLADEVLVMSARPGRILETLTVALPRPRHFDMLGSEVMGQARNHIWHLIGDAPVPGNSV